MHAAAEDAVKIEISKIGGEGVGEGVKTHRTAVKASENGDRTAVKAMKSEIEGRTEIKWRTENGSSVLPSYSPSDLGGGDGGGEDKMSRRGSRVNDEDINDPVSKLQALLPHSSSTRTRLPPSKILKEACSYIRKMHIEVDNLTERLSEVLESMENNRDDDADILRDLLQR